MTTPKRNEAVAPVAWLVVSGDAKVLCVAEATANAQAFELRKGGYPVTIFPLYLSDSIDALQGEVSRLREALEDTLRVVVALAHRDCPDTISRARKALNLEPPTDGR